MTRRVYTGVGIAVVVTALLMSGASLRGHGPYWITLDTIQRIEPPHRAEYGRGELGVVRPKFARRYLVQAYRVFSGGSPLPQTAVPAWELQQLQMPKTSPVEDWTEARDRTLGLTTTPADRGQLYYARYRTVADNQQILNCPDAAFANAVRALKARSDRFGGSSPEVRDWAKAQVAVFRNCSEEELVLPDAAPASAQPLVRADRAYQAAAAYFYGMQFEEAERRFRAIGSDPTSPWRRYGRYLAARSQIRRATLSESDPEQLLHSAETELRAVIGDPDAAELHQSAQGLLDHLATTLRPVERLHAVAKVLTASASPSAQDIIDYRWLMDKLIGDTVDYDYAEVQRRDEIIQDDDLEDWVLAMQGGGAPALDRALTRWHATHSPLWLVPVLWKIPPDHATAVSVLEASAGVDRKSSAYPTVAFLRVRLLIRMGRLNDARALLAALPEKPQPGFQAEALNLLKGERLMLARSFDEWLAAAPRAIVTNFTRTYRTPQGEMRTDRKEFDAAAFDEDAAAVLSDRLPLTRLVQASTSATLPDRLKLRVAAAALARSIVLRRDEAGVQIATVMRRLAPPLQADLDRYIGAATPEDRHHAAILFLLRTPGIHAYVRGLDDDGSYDAAEPERQFAHSFGTNWWCGFDQRSDSTKAGTAGSELVALLYADPRMPYPTFLTAAERAATERELRAMAAAGPARSYITAETITWARAKPTDQHVAEALAKAIDGWRWSCGDGDSGDLPARAFQILHKQFPQSEWARQTKYSYK